MMATPKPLILTPSPLHHPLLIFSIKPPAIPTKTKPLTIACSSSSKIVRCPSLDRHATAHNRLRFVRKLTTLLLSKPRHFLPLRILSRCRPYLSLPPRRPLLPMIHRYPTLFRLLHTPSFSSLSSLSVALTPAALSLFSRCSRNSSVKLQKLLMLSAHPRLLLSKLVHLAPDLGFPANFRSRICNSHPDLFRTVDTSYGRALELVSCDHNLAVIMPTPLSLTSTDRPIIDRPPKFKKLKLRRGLNVKRRHLDYLIRFQELPEINPYVIKMDENVISVEEKEKRACAVVREVLGMCVEKRTLVDHLTHFRKEFGLPNKLRAMLIRHPEMFYVSVKGERDSVFLVEAYDDKGRLMVEDEMVRVREELEELVREGKRMRRERRRGGGLISEDKEEVDEEEEDDQEYFDEADELETLFESGIGDDWEDFGDREVDLGDDEEKEFVEFWSLKGANERRGNEDGEGMLEAW